MINQSHSNAIINEPQVLTNPIGAHATSGQAEGGVKTKKTTSGLGFSLPVKTLFTFSAKEEMKETTDETPDLRLANMSDLSSVLQTSVHSPGPTYLAFARAQWQVPIHSQMPFELAILPLVGFMVFWVAFPSATVRFGVRLFLIRTAIVRAVAMAYHYYWNGYLIRIRIADEKGALDYGRCVITVRPALERSRASQLNIALGYWKTIEWSISVADDIRWQAANLAIPGLTSIMGRPECDTWVWSSGRINQYDHGTATDVDAFANHNVFISPPSDESFDQSPSSRYRQTPPPQDQDTSAAGARTTYMHRGQMTPVSQPSQSRHASPVNVDTADDLRGSQEHSRSRNTSENASEAFEIANLPTKRPGGYGGFDDRGFNTRDQQRTGAKLMERINNTIPGPFDSARRPFVSRNAYPQRKDSLDHSSQPPPPPSDGQIPPRLPARDGYEGFGAPIRYKNGHQASLVRSEPYPNPFSSSPPPRTDLLAGHDSRKEGSVDLAAEFGINNPYHTSMSSVSSGDSDSSVSSHITAQTSPSVEDPWSNGDGTKNHNALRIDAGAANLPRFAPQVVETPAGTSSRNFRYDRVSPGPGPSPGSGSGQHTAAPYREEYSRSRTKDAGGHRFQTSNEHVDLPLPKRQDTLEPSGKQGHVSLPSRGDCKGCGIAITGKSISSADGRLTGKYHKACFVCSTCCKPFPSCVFYVLGDKPYCAQDYHRLNNSICGSCGSGIEGQFAEDEARVKYHVGCFCCLDCGLSLTDGYFEVGGYAYCERDAWKRVQAQSFAEQETYQPSPPRLGDRPIPSGLPARPSHHSGQSGRSYQLPPPSNANSRGGRMVAGGADPRFRMNKRMTRLGNMNL
ncbi:hypothetical protein E4U21_002067 [Claviceps maximensis]|nr:hypothetical protein E4U21_002067 [Claviceps maximensis]